jgi:hypothetical protein
MRLGAGSIESGLHRSAMEKVDYAAGQLGILPRLKWVGLMTAPLPQNQYFRCSTDGRL